MGKQDIADLDIELVSDMTKTSINIFAKSSIIGTVKTRMNPPLSLKQCLELHQALIRNTLYQVQSLSGSSIDISVCMTGILDQALDYATDLNFPKNVAIDIQLGLDLGERLESILRMRMENNYSEVIFIGTDCPSLESRTIEKAIKILRHKDVVVGPALDGGYYLLGFSSYAPCILKGISWGTSKVYQQTVVILEKHLIQWTGLAPKSDLDTFENLKELWQDLKFSSFLRKKLDRDLLKVLGEIMDNSDSYLRRE